MHADTLSSESARGRLWALTKLCQIRGHTHAQNHNHTHAFCVSHTNTHLQPNSHTHAPEECSYVSREPTHTLTAHSCTDRHSQTHTRRHFYTHKSN